MLLIQAAALGLVQGLSEFLPISSSGHLILVRDLMGWSLLENAHWNTAFDVAVHAGTFLSLVLYFRSDIARLFRALGSSVRRGIAGDPERRLAWLIVIGTIPAAVAGAAWESAIEARLRDAPMLVAALLVAFGLLLWLAEWRGRKTRKLAEATWWDGVLVGFAQALSLAPGVSRSGITMTAGLARGMSREAAARFSFLLSIPIVGGVAAYSLLGLAGEAGERLAAAAPIFACGMLTAAVSGYLCIHYFLRYLQRRALAPFVLYRLVVGAGLLLWFALHPTG